MVFGALQLRGYTPALAAGLLALSLAGCSRTDTDSDGASLLTVAVSIPPQAYLVERIGGEHVRVVTVLRPGDSPHSYLPSDQEISDVMRARLYFRIGVPFESGKWFETVNRSGRLRVVDTRAGIALREMETHGDGEAADGHRHSADCDHTGLDPHIWLAPALLQQQAKTIADALCETAPEQAQAFRRNLEALSTDLDALDAEIRNTLASLRGASLYVYHPSWGYFCDAYGLHQHAIEVEGKDPSDAELTALQEQARGERVKVIFVQPQIAGRAAQAIAKALGAEVRTLDPLERDVIANLRAAAEAVKEAR